MFKKSTTTKQLDLFSSPSGLMCVRESRKYDVPAAWHNKFYREVTGNIDEEIFRPLFAKERKDGRAGRMDSKLISSNIAWFSRYEIIHETLMQQVSKLK